MAHQAREQPGDPIHHRDAYAKVAAGGSMPGSGPNQRLRLAGSAWFFFPRAAQAMADMGGGDGPSYSRGPSSLPGPTASYSAAFCPAPSSHARPTPRCAGDGRPGSPYSVPISPYRLTTFDCGPPGPHRSRRSPARQTVRQCAHSAGTGKGRDALAPVTRVGAGLTARTTARVRPRAKTNTRSTRKRPIPASPAAVR